MVRAALCESPVAPFKQVNLMTRELCSVLLRGATLSERTPCCRAAFSPSVSSATTTGVSLVRTVWASQVLFEISLEIHPLRHWIFLPYAFYTLCYIVKPVTHAFKGPGLPSSSCAFATEDSFVHSINRVFTEHLLCAKPVVS